MFIQIRSRFHHTNKRRKKKTKNNTADTQKQVEHVYDVLHGGTFESPRRAWLFQNNEEIWSDGKQYVYGQCLGFTNTNRKPIPYKKDFDISTLQKDIFSFFSLNMM